MAMKKHSEEPGAQRDIIDAPGHSVPAELIAYCRACERYFDVRSGCEADIRQDERLKVAEEWATAAKKAP